ncbi:MAG: hypothetical protein KatS3mg117_3075 [Geminicoccaceae bacterium]|jgi:hypothetical protein|nr:MAG: hypothetical protein KatS3mg117_3075 [Geminicoccaceae bacterium]
MTNTPYSDDFFASNKDGSKVAAERVMPWLIERLEPRSVVDFGCGVAAWLETARRHGISDLLGIEGPWIDGKVPTDLPILLRDLEQPIVLDRTFDLALCLEVAEHLPADRSAGLVQDLTRAAPRVLFSAAVPGQIGVRHINERWPSFWDRLFAEQGFECLDVVRPVFWNDSVVPCWYRQNIVLYVREDIAETTATRFGMSLPTTLRDIVHPEIMAYYAKNYYRASFRFLARLVLNRLGFSR